jgi:hypothetical protein
MKVLSNLLDNSNVDIIQIIKWLVYLLLVINFGFYIKDDLEIASFTMRNGGTLLEWTSAYATTIDISAWIILLLLFELETYILSDDPLPPVKQFIMQSVRIICYFSLCHTLYAYSVNVYQLSLITPILDVDNLCQLVNTDISFVTNLLYTELDKVNCNTLSTASQFFYLEPPQFLIVTDAPGFIIEKQLAWFDLLEIFVWLMIILTIEIIVRLQDRKITSGNLIKRLNITKGILYSMLWIVIFYWIYRGHYMYAWDEFVWIAGFMAIEMNVVEWRDEIQEEQNETRLATES